MVDFFDLYQHQQIKQTHRLIEQTARTNESQRSDARHQMEVLHDRIDRLTLLCESMWQLVMEATGYSEEDLDARWGNLDLEDGEADGRRHKLPMSCNCGAMVHPSLAKCQYCGAKAPARAAFDRI